MYMCSKVFQCSWNTEKQKKKIVRVFWDTLFCRCSSVQFYLCSKVFWCSGFTACTCHHEPTTNRESAASMNIQREWFLTSRWLALKCNFNYVIVLLLILYFWFEKHGNYKSHVMVLPSHTCILKHKRNKMEKRKFFPFVF